MAKEGAVQVSMMKGGHPPAVKAGGMRVSKKQGNDENVTPEKVAKKTPEKPSSAVNLTKMQAMNILAGALEKLSHEFPAEAAQMAHQKPRPTVEKLVLPKRLPIIQQPRRC